jgi:hypothetical protein
MIITRILILLIAATLAGCASPVRVPANAELLFYGPPTSFTGTRPKVPGQAWLFNESRNRVEMVMAVDEKQDFRFFGLNPRHRYRVYFVPSQAAAMSPAAAKESAANH